MRLTSLSFLSFGLLGACGGGSSTTPDAPAAKDVGFNKPTKLLKANKGTTSGTTTTWSEIGDADLTCLNTANDDVATSVAVTLNTVVKDFQSGTLVPSAITTAFTGIDSGTPFDTKTADANGNVTLTIPVGTKRFGFKMTTANGTTMPTLLLNQTVDAGVAIQPTGSDTDPSKNLKIQSVSMTTAMLLPALIGEERIVGTGVAAGALRDCQRREMSNFVATVSSTPTTATPVAGTEAYYFSPSANVPVKHTQADAAREDGIFMLIQVPVTSAAYVQAWGFPTQADLDGGTMKLISELKVPVIADTVITGSFEPIRQ